MKMEFRLIAIVIFALPGCATFEPGTPEGMVDVIAHRGASAYAPENTLAAFELAVEQGAHWFELDCTLSRDGRVIVIHDDTVDRTTTGTGRVGDLSLPDLKALDAGSWKDPAFAGVQIPTLEEALDLAKDRIGVYIEIKNSDDDRALIEGINLIVHGESVIAGPSLRSVAALIKGSASRNVELTRRVIDIVQERNMKREVVIQSFSPVICLTARIEGQGIRTEFLASADEDDPNRWVSALRWNNLLGVSGFNVNHAALNESNLGHFHDQGKSVAVWTVDDPTDMARFAGWGVDGIITNRPDVCLEVLRDLAN